MRNAGFQAAEPLVIWTVTDGRAGIENQALGLAEAIGRRTPATIVAKRIRLRTPWSWLPPGFVPAPRQALALGSDALEPPWPDIWIGCGRASIPYSMGVRSWSRHKTLVAQLQDPRINPREFDLVVPPVHDGLEGANVLPIIGSCHRVTTDKLEQGRLDYPEALDEFPGPRFAVLIGGKSKRHDISPRRAKQISQSLIELQRRTGGSLLVTLSRRTSDAARAQFGAWLAPHATLFYEGEGQNPYFAMLASADAIFVTADSVNMATEAAATGRPIHVLRVDGKAGKLERFYDSLHRRGCARFYDGALAFWNYPPLLETDRVAAALISAYAARAGAR
jgi:mitochondrial fission protein ELM1